MGDTYEWRFCKECHQRIFKDEVKGDTIKVVNDEIYCMDCAIINETGNIYYEGED